MPARETRQAPRKPVNRAKTIAEEIEELLRPIRDLFALLAEADTPEGFEEAVFLVKTAAMRWAAALVPNPEAGEVTDDTADQAAQSLMQLVMVSQALGKILAGKTVHNIHSTPFWSTPLGQMVFASNGFHRRPASLQEAGAVLRLTRQAVSYLIKTPNASRLETVPGNSTLITRGSLYREWVRREAIREAQEAEPEGELVRWEWPPSNSRSVS